MIELMTEVATPDGAMDAYVTYPEEGGPFPGVLILMDIWGLREELFAIARKISVTGYYCAVPNFYYRQGAVRFEFRDEHGMMKSFSTIGEENKARMHVHMSALKDEMAMQDMHAILSFLKTQPVSSGPKGLVGYCLGGRYALQAAALYPDDFQASVSLHGTRLANDAPLSPHRLAGSCKGEIYCGFGEHDELAPPSVRAALHEAFAANAAIGYREIVHRGAAHGYGLPDRDVYDRKASDRDWENIFAMLRRRLG